jgi:hypothetical protein
MNEEGISTVRRACAAKFSRRGRKLFPQPSSRQSDLAYSSLLRLLPSCLYPALYNLMTAPPSPPSPPDSQHAFIYPCKRSLPSHLKWTSPPIPINYEDLPPLPAIHDDRLAQQARTSKDYLISTKGLSKHDTYDHEIASYRPLEWLGDGKLHQAYSEGLSRLLPDSGSGVLSVSCVCLLD